MQGSLEEDLAALRKLRDDASGALKEYFGDGEDPREWKDDDGDEIVAVEDGRVTGLWLLSLSSLAVLPDAIGELGALTELVLYNCSSLTTLPAVIGELGALTTLVLYGCSSLEKLPDSIGKLGALTTLNLRGCSSLTYPPKEMHVNVHKTVGFCCLNLLEGGKVPVADVKETILHEIVFGGTAERIDALASKDSAFAELTKSARADVAALRKLRADDESGALKEYFGDGEDPLQWKDGDGDNIVTVADGRVTELSLFKCSSLVALPAAIGELKALTTLNLHGCPSLAALPAAIGELKALTKLNLIMCSSLAALPESIGGLDALMTLRLIACPNLVFPPGHTHGDVKRIKRLLANTTRRRGARPSRRSAYGARSSERSCATFTLPMPTARRRTSAGRSCGF